VTVIFVCTGNTCRSPLAEAIARHMAEERGITDVSFTSAGIGAVQGAPASDPAVLIGIERGLDLSRHRSRQFTAALADANTLVLGLSGSHVQAAKLIAPDARIYLLDEYASRGATYRSVSDPFGGELADYRTAADDIEVMLASALDRIAAERVTRGQ
jgi:protein-tyrosine-phosphatase